MVEEKAYCRYEGENSQRHLEGSRLNRAMVGAVREEEKKEERQALKGEEERGRVD